MSFRPIIAPTKVLIVPITNSDKFAPLVGQVLQSLRRLAVSSRVDDSGASIGRRYARNDELGTPFGITIDYQTIKDQTVTLRDRDSTRQVRDTQEKIFEAVRALVDGTKTWADVEAELPRFESQETELPSHPAQP